ncbi:Pkinase-domain-containing protein [Macrolepiota fuliginosa MF-IS2]|uniref:non-specific serine/threonine protein kinase n=1 Tax=Macrolepiota fuliginosa MF-IS2 TaxID=1400762 RepID=A0A9P5XIM6_9AGAR|nr:Pkinase-domain-containing protein [Macrolepiota fuliginosa MF-IS2]
MQPAPPSRRTASSSSTRRTGSDEELRPYVIVSDIGKGSFATVYKGYHEETHHQVAIKTVVTDKLSSKLFENLQSEIQILKSLSHRHITRLIDIVRAEKNVYLIMEFCAGGDLTNYIKKRGRVDGLQYLPSPSAAPQYYPHPSTGGLDEVVVRSFLRQLARALKFLRHRNLIHRDIKPQNLLLNPASTEELARGHPLGVPILKVADFGFARSLPNAMMAETLCGSPLYMAPEILRYEKYDAKADLWSVGAVLYEMAVGKPPFRANNHIELLKKIEHARSIKFPDEDPPSRKHTSNSNGEDQQPVPVPDDIKQLIRALLRRQPAERASFEEFFNSNALAKSKFPRPRDMEPPSMQGSAVGEDEDTSRDWPGRPPTPEHHKIIPPEVLDPKAMIPPSRFNFRRPSETLPPPNQMLLRQQQQQHQVQSGMDGSPRGANAALPRVVSGGREHGREGAAAGGGGGGGVQGEVNRTVFPSIGGRRSARPLSTEGSFIPGETEEDGVLRREYVLVDDTRAVEFNRAVDEISAHPRRPLHDRQMPPTPSVDEYPPDSNNSGIGANTNISINTNTNNITFPPPPHAAAPPLSSSPSSMASRAASNALHRALNLASKKLFGTSRSHSHSNSHSHSLSHTNPSSTTSSPRRPILALDGGGSDGAGGVGVGGGGGGGPNGERDPMEDELLASLEELAQKTDVLTHWADEMYEYVKAIPQKPLPDPTKFTKREGELEKHARRRKHADMEAEYNAVTCVAVYMLLMSFSQKGINLLREFQEHMGMKYPAGDYVVSEGFDDALNWFKEHFMKCNDRAALVKTWLPAQYDGAKAWLDQLVYDRALVLSRTAARKELLDQASGPDECEKLYEESLWCLYALQDDLLQTGNPFMEEDRETIATWIKRTKLRLVRCRARMAMNDRDRMNDARADLNLADVARIPAPWDARPTDGAANGVPQVFNSSS